MMTLADVRAELHLDYAHEGLEEEWAESSSAQTDEAALSDETTANLCRMALVPDEYVPALVEAGRLVRSSEAIGRLFQHCVYWLRRVEDYSPKTPKLPATAEVHQDLVNVLLLIQLVPEMLKQHRARNIPPDVTRDTLGTLPIRMKFHHKWHGRIGYNELRWFLLHLKGRLYRVGRLQYLLAPLHQHLVVFRHRDSRALQALSQAGVHYSADGQYIVPEDAAGAWRSVLNISDTTIRGNPISRRGVASGPPIDLPREEWQQVLDATSTMLDVHIPEGSPLTPDACLASFRSAVSFFTTHFPERPYKGFMCTSWLLDSQFEEVLSADSNILRFQDWWYLLPSRPNHAQAAWFVFRTEGNGDVDVATAPRETSLQRGLLKLLRQGKRFHAEGGFFICPPGAPIERPERWKAEGANAGRDRQ